MNMTYKDLEKWRTLRYNNGNKMTDDDKIIILMFILFNKDKTEQLTKEAEEAGMTLTEYLESTSPRNKYYKCNCEEVYKG